MSSDLSQVHRHLSVLFSELPSAEIRPWSVVSTCLRKELTLPVISFVVLLVSVNAVYNVFFHPLRCYPGPLLAKITSAYGVYHALKGDMHLVVQKLHVEYGRFAVVTRRLNTADSIMLSKGEVVRYGPNRLIFNTTAALEDIYGYKKPIQKSRSYLPMVPWKDGWTVATCIDKDHHRKMRRTLINEMSNDRLRQLEPSIIAQLDRFIHTLTARSNIDVTWSDPRDMTMWSTAPDMPDIADEAKTDRTPGKCLSIDTMSQLGFGQSVGMVERPEKDFIAYYLSLYGMRMGAFFQWPELAFLGLEKLFDMISTFLPSARKFNAWRRAYTQHTIDANGQAKCGIFSHVVRGSQRSAKGYQYSTAQMAAEGGFLILVGSDSNSAALAGALYYLSRFPDVRQKLESEIWDAFPDASGISAFPPSPMPSLQYLKAFTSEVLRMCPPTPGVPWREVEQGGGTIDGHFVPGGVDVGICIWPFQRRPDVFRDPNRFWPERWLPETLPAAELEAANTCNKPFSIGARGCAGKKVAMMQVQLALVKLLWHCEIKVPTGLTDRTPDFPLATHFSAVTQGPWLQFAMRSGRPDVRLRS